MVPIPVCVKRSVYRDMCPTEERAAARLLAR